MPVIFVLLLGWSAFGDTQALRYTPEEILQAVASYQQVSLRDDVPVPKIYFESTCPLEQFQNAIEPQWNMRPERFLNAYVIHSNEIYIIDEAAYYEQLGRFIDDSLAHEFAHFLQVKYQGYAVLDSDYLEYVAIEVQTWFRENYLKPKAERL